VANLNKIILIGKLETDPEAHSTLEGIPMAKFKLAVDRVQSRNRNDKDSFDIIAWRRLAEICSEFLKKGRLVLVEGSIQNRSFDDQLGNRQWVTEIVARNMQMLEKPSGSQKPQFAAPMDETEGAEDVVLDSDLPF
jgi:single-strand DNA-binding protein